MRCSRSVGQLVKASPASIAHRHCLRVHHTKPMLISAVPPQRQLRLQSSAAARPPPSPNSSSSSSKLSSESDQAAAPGAPVAQVQHGKDTATGTTESMGSPSAAAAASTPTSESQQPPPALPEPSQEGNNASTPLTVDGQGVKLDHLGPLVVNHDGTMGRVANWTEMTAMERENTLRILGRRNQSRLKKLRDSATAASSSSSSSSSSSAAKANGGPGPHPAADGP